MSSCGFRVWSDDARLPKCNDVMTSVTETCDRLEVGAVQPAVG